MVGVRWDNITTTAKRQKQNAISNTICEYEAAVVLPGHGILLITVACARDKIVIISTLPEARSYLFQPVNQ